MAISVDTRVGLGEKEESWLFPYGCSAVLLSVMATWLLTVSAVAAKRIPVQVPLFPEPTTDSMGVP